MPDLPPAPFPRSPTGAHHPTENAYNRLAHRQLDAALAYAAGRYLRGRLVDVGAGLKPYRDLFAPYVTEHVGVDHPDSPHPATEIDISATAYDVPAPDGSFDSAVLIEVLEHLEEPTEALREVRRLLAPGGHVVLSTPFVWPLHEEPRDFFRYSPHGLRHLLETAGFEVVEIRPVSGQWATVVQLAGYAARNSHAIRLGRVLDALVSLAGRWAAWADRRRVRPWMSWNHLAVARRPADAGGA